MTRGEMLKLVALINNKFGGPIANALFLPDNNVVKLTIFGDTITFDENLDTTYMSSRQPYYGSTCGSPIMGT